MGWASFDAQLRIASNSLFSKDVYIFLPPLNAAEARLFKFLNCTNNILVWRIT